MAKKEKSFSLKKYLIVVILLVIVLFLIIIGKNFIFRQEKFRKACGDDTPYEQCSSRKPYFCLKGKLVEKASICGCNENLSINGDFCISRYQTEPKNITLKYISRGEEKEADFVVYKGMADYLAEIPRDISYIGNEKPSKADFKLRNINNEEQREMLLPLVTKIQNLDKNEIEQVRIAISIVQKISFGNSNKTIFFGRNIINYSRYPYEVLYDVQGVCGEKSELLAFILRELGYGVVFFYNAPENHEAVGIKCPVKYSLDETGYCFVETTGSSIISDNKIEYVGVGKLFSESEIIFISDGKSLPENMYEYKDAEDLIKLKKVIDNNERINLFQYKKLEKLKKKYGLEEFYNP